MLVRLKERAECYEKWHAKVKAALDAPDDKKVGKSCHCQYTLNS